MEQAAIEPPNIIDRYLKAFKIEEDTFEIYFPGGEPIKCRRPRRYGSLKEAMEQAAEWHKQLTREDLATDHPLVFAAVSALGPVPISVKESVASFFVKHFCIEPLFNDVQAAELIGCPELLQRLYDQIVEELSIREQLRQLNEVKEEGKGSKAMSSTTPEPSPAKNSDTRTQTT